MPSASVTETETDKAQVCRPNSELCSTSIKKEFWTATAYSYLPVRLITTKDTTAGKSLNEVGWAGVD